MNRREAVKYLASGAVAAAFPSASFAQGYPAKPIRLISPWSAGGTSDLVLRAFAESAAKRLGTNFVIENKPGAGGTFGAVELARAAPDGYTLSQLALSIFSLPHMQQTQFDPLKDITYIARLTTYTNGLVVRAESALKSLKDLVDYAKANPGRLTYATSGIGSSPHLSVEEFAARAGVQLVNVPYKADSESLLALMSGQVDALSGTTSWGPHVDSGKLRLLAIYGSKRAKRWPNAPTLNELGYPVPDTPFGIGGPRGMDAAIVKRLQDAFHAALEDPAVQATLDRFDMPLAWLDSAEYTKNAQEMFQQQGAMIRRLGLKS